MEEVFAMPRVLGTRAVPRDLRAPLRAAARGDLPGDPRNAGAAATFEARKPARCNAIPLPSDTRAALERMRQAGVRIVVSSNNGTENVDAFARNAGFPFDLVLGFGDGLAKGKPHLDACSRAFGLDRQEMLFIGDSLHDGEIAEREGIPFVGLATTFAPGALRAAIPARSRSPQVRRL